LVQTLCDEYGTNQQIAQLVNTTSIYILPSMNPDGFELDQRENANGIDLNRNFPDQFLSPTDTTSGRQPETVNVMQWSRSRNFVLSANLHGGAIVANYPYDGTASGLSEYSESPDDAIFRQISLAYSIANPDMYNSSYFKDGITNGAAWYALYGGLQDWSYVYRSDFDITLELSNQKYPAESTLPSFWVSNRQSMINYMMQIHNGMKGNVTDSVTGASISNATITVDLISKTVSSTSRGEYFRLLVPNKYVVSAAAPGYQTTSQYIEVQQTGATVVNFALQLGDSTTSTTSSDEASTACSRRPLSGVVLLLMCFVGVLFCQT